MKRKLLVIVFLVLALVFVLSSCNGDKEVNTDDAQTTQSVGNIEGVNEKPEGETDFVGNGEVEEQTTEDPEKIQKYNDAFDLIANRKYEEAYAVFVGLGDFRDSAEQLGKFRYVPIGAIEPYQVVEYTYNENNLLASATYIKPDDSVSTYEYLYDEDGNLIKRIFNRTTDNSWVDEYFYDENGYLVKSIRTGSDGSQFIDEWWYDDHGETIKNIRTDISKTDSSTLVWTETYEYEYEYDAEGRMVKQVFIYNGTTNSTYEYMYDSNGNLISEFGMKAEDGSWDRAEYTYDLNGNLTREYYSYVDGSFDYTDYFYDSNGNLIKSIYTNGEDQDPPREYWYDDNGNCIKYQYYHTGKNYWYAAEYTYDEYDNVIEIRKVTGDNTVTTIEYKFVYIATEVPYSIESIINSKKNYSVP